MGVGGDAIASANFSLGGLDLLLLASALYMYVLVLSIPSLITILAILPSEDSCDRLDICSIPSVLQQRVVVFLLGARERALGNAPTSPNTPHQGAHHAPTPPPTPGGRKHA